MDPFVAVTFSSLSHIILFANLTQKGNILSQSVSFKSLGISTCLKGFIQRRQIFSHSITLHGTVTYDGDFSQVKHFTGALPVTASCFFTWINHLAQLETICTATRQYFSLCLSASSVFLRLS